MCSEYGVQLCTQHNIKPIFYRCSESRIHCGPVDNGLITFTLDLLRDIGGLRSKLYFDENIDGWNSYHIQNNETQNLEPELGYTTT